MDTGDISAVLERLRSGDPEALDRLVPLLYDELRSLARGQLRREHRNHTLNTTGLVHEAYLRLRADGSVPGASRADFFAAACQSMRRVLVDWARARKRAKRGGGREPLPLEEAEVFLTLRQADEILALEDALGDLARVDERSARVVVHRFFGGLTLAESAAILGVSEKTVQRSWNLGRAWLRRELSRELDGLGEKG